MNSICVRQTEFLKNNFINLKLSFRKLFIAINNINFASCEAHQYTQTDSTDSELQTSKL